MWIHIQLLLSQESSFGPNHVNGIFKTRINTMYTLAGNGIYLYINIAWCVRFIFFMAWSQASNFRSKHNNNVNPYLGRKMFRICITTTTAVDKIFRKITPLTSRLHVALDIDTFAVSYSLSVSLFSLFFLSLSHKSLYIYIF